MSDLLLNVDRALSEGAPGVRVLPVDRASLHALEPALAAAHQRLLDREAAGEVGFLTLDRAAWGVDDAVRIGGELRTVADVLVILGIGGSALGARALDRALGPASGAGGSHRLVVLDTVDPHRVRQVLAELDPARTAVAVISKSGGTVETAALFRAVLPWLQAGRDDWRRALAVVTDRTRGSLRPLADAEGLAALPIPDDVGGRFSVLTAVGALPAAFAGIDLDGLFVGAEAMAGAVRRPALADNPAWQLAGLHHLWWGEANISVLFAYSERLRSVGEWFVQLWGESLGKVRPDGVSVGWTPLFAMGPVDQHSQLQLFQEGPRDKLITVLRVEDPGPDVELGSLPGDAQAVAAYLDGQSLAGLMDAERRGTTAALVDAGRPVIELSLPRIDARSVGALLVLFEAATAITGHLAGVDPFDQPGVELGKRYAYGLMGREGFHAEAARAQELLGG